MLLLGCFWSLDCCRVTRLLEDFVEISKSGFENHKHQEATPAFQKRYKKDVENLVEVLEEVGNQFLDTKSGDLISLDTGNIVTEWFIAAFGKPMNFENRA